MMPPKKQHNKVVLQVHWRNSKKNELKASSKWYKHQPLPNVKNEEGKLTWDMIIYTDKKLEHNWSDITILLKEGKE